MIWLTEEKLAELRALTPEQLKPPKPRRIVAFDVETPNGKNDSICSIGLTVIENEQVVDSVEFLVNPDEEFDWFCTRIHGITAEDVADAPLFYEIWPKIKEIMGDSLLLAHNARFDLGVLRRLIDKYELDFRDSAAFVDTVQLSRSFYGDRMPNHKLGTLCDQLGIALDAHHAGSDSYGCAMVYLSALRDGADVESFERIYSFTEPPKPKKHRRNSGDFCG